MLKAIIRFLIEHEPFQDSYICKVCGAPVFGDHLSTPDFRIDTEAHFCSQMCYRTFMVMYSNGDA